MLGHVASGWGHVHFAELVGGRYVNPLRPGALTPYVDTTLPTIHTFSFEHEGRSLGHTRLARPVDLVAEVWDETPVRAPGKWAGKPVMPAVVRWRIVGRRGSTTAWTTAIDFTGTIPAPSMFDALYAPWTRQNHAWRPGRYRVRLAHGWDPSSLPRGPYLLEVEAADTRGNRTRRSTSFTVV